MQQGTALRWHGGPESYPDVGCDVFCLRKGLERIAESARMSHMTHETCDVLDLLEELGLEITWSEAFDASIRRVVYSLRAVDNNGERWIILGDHEADVVDAFIEQLDWDVFDRIAMGLPAPTA